VTTLFGMEQLLDIISKSELAEHLGLKAFMAKRANLVIRKNGKRSKGLTLSLLRGPLFVDVRKVYDNEGVLQDGGRDMIIAYDVSTLMRQFDLTTTQAKKLATKIDTL